MKTTANYRQLLGSARYYYQRHALATEHVNEELRLVLAGERGSLRRLKSLEAIEDDAWLKLQPYLQEIAAQVRKPDDEGFQEYLSTEQQKIARTI